MDDLLARSYFNNTVQEYLISLGIGLGGILLVRLFRIMIIKRLKKWSDATETNLDDMVVRGVEKFALPLLNLLIFYWAIHYLTFSEGFKKVIHVAIALVITFYLVRMISSTLQLILKAFIQKQEKGEEKLKQMKGMMVIINITLWFFGSVALLSNLGYDVTTIITGLGIGGIAVALAAQNILGDLFNYFVIFFDRPFEIGDFVVIDDKNGTVEYIGIKTTRIRTLNGEMLIISNSDLTQSRVHNYKVMTRRRVIFSIGVTYDTPIQQLKELPELFKKIIDDEPEVTFDRAHFFSYGDFSLNFELVMYVESGDYNVYMNHRQSINLKIAEAFEERKIEFAFPTQTLYVKKDHGTPTGNL